MPPTQARDRVLQMATRDTTAALEAARRIDDPWYACQALAWVARYAPDERVTAIADEALKSADSQVPPRTLVRRP